MTDKEKMRADFEVAIPKFEDHDGGTAVYFTDEEYEEVAWPVWQAAKKSDRKEREAAHSETMEQARLLGMGGEREAILIGNLEAAKQRIAELESDIAGDDERFLKYEAQVQDLEKKPADTEELVKCNYSQAARWAKAATEAEEREAAARQQGFEEGKKTLACPICYEAGKKAGRDELQKVLSEQEPVAWLNPVSLLPYDNKWNAGNEHPEWIALIPRPLPPQAKG